MEAGGYPDESLDSMFVESSATIPRDDCMAAAISLSTAVVAARACSAEAEAIWVDVGRTVLPPLAPAPRSFSSLLVLPSPLFLRLPQQRSRFGWEIKRAQYVTIQKRDITY